MACAQTLADLATSRLGSHYPPVTADEIHNVLVDFKRLGQRGLRKLKNVLDEEEKAFPRSSYETDVWKRGVRYDWSLEKEADETFLDNPLSVHQQFKSIWTLSVVMCVDVLARAGPGFPEFEQLPNVILPILESLAIKMELKSKPVSKPKFGKQEPWTTLTAVFETTAPVTQELVESAVRLGADFPAQVPDKIRVEFVLEDAIDTFAPWGSAPLLHVGSNFNLPDETDTEDSKTGAKRHATTSNVCFVYSQKNPTLEIPSKLTEVRQTILGLVNESAHLFQLKSRPKRSLAVSMAICHPKTRFRLVAQAFVVCFLPQTSFNKHHEDASRIIEKRLVIGHDANFSIKPHVSRKISLATDVCRACSRMCDSGNHPAHVYGRVPYLSDVAVRMGLREDVERSTLSVLPLYEIPRNLGCRSSAVAHHFFCEGVVPCSIEGVTDDMAIEAERKNSLLVYARLKKKNMDIKLRTFGKNLSGEQYFDLLEQKCDINAARRYLDMNRAVHIDNGGATRWLPLIRHTIDIHRASRCFADRLANLNTTMKIALQLQEHRNNTENFARQCSEYIRERGQVLRMWQPASDNVMSVQQRNNQMGVDTLNTLQHLADKRQATMLVMMNRSFVVASRLVIGGVRGTISFPDGPAGRVELHQFVAISAGMVVAPVSKFTLSHLTVLKDNLSAAHAPVDTLKCDSGGDKENNIPPPPPPPSPPPKSELYIPPHARCPLQRNRSLRPQTMNDSYRNFGSRCSTGRWWGSTNNYLAL